MISVDEALEFVLKGAGPLKAESVPLNAIAGRVAAKDHIACLTQPPFSASAMDGYAARFDDAALGRSLRVIGEAPAGRPFTGTVEEGTAVRVFTGAVLPDGADHVIIQEDVAREGERITVTAGQPVARNIRPAGLDFKAGDSLAVAGQQLGVFHGALFAAGNLSEAACVRRPRVALFTSGDELREPGSDLAPGEIVNSNPFAIKALIEAWGGDADDLGCASDTLDAATDMFLRASEADIIVPIGGASVGDYDYMRAGFTKAGGKLVFEKVAVRPGKPTWYGQIGSARVIGLPGNPSSAIVTAALFLQPLLLRLAGNKASTVSHSVATATDLPANGARETYLRAERLWSEEGELTVRVFSKQDSSMLSVFTRCDALIRRPAHAPEVIAGTPVDIIPITGRFSE